MGSKKAVALLGLMLCAAGIVAYVSYSSVSTLQLWSTADEDCARHAFIRFKRDHNKLYSTAEEDLYRFRVFKQAIIKIEAMNEASTHNNGIGASFAVNKFADLTEAEFKSMYLGYLGKPVAVTDGEEPLPVSTGDHDVIDWVFENKVSAVKDQGACGSCWAFSATGSLESAYAIKNGNVVTFSEQQLVDCSAKEGNHGCNGGLMDNAFTYFESNSAESESSYPYTAQDGQCSADSSQGIVKVSSYTDVTYNDEEALYTALKQQPISVAIDATQIMYYHDGVITPDFCNFQKLDHGVLLVGYHVD